jgi:hypothetical protein
MIFDFRFLPAYLPPNEGCQFSYVIVWCSLVAGDLDMCSPESDMNEVCFQDSWYTYSGAATAYECYSSLKNQYGPNEWDACPNSYYFTFISANDYGSTQCYCCGSMYDPYSDSSSTDYYSPTHSETAFTYSGCWTDTSFSSASTSYYMPSYYGPSYGSSSSSSTYLLTGTELPGACASEYQGFNNVGRCSSNLDYDMGYMHTPSECWEACEVQFGSSLAAIDWTGDPWSGNGGSCFCHDNCECTVDDQTAVCSVVSDDNVLCYDPGEASSSTATTPVECFEELQDNGGCSNWMYAAFVPSDGWSSPQCHCCDTMFYAWGSMGTETYYPMGSESGYTYACDYVSSSTLSSSYSMMDTTYLLTAPGLALPGECTVNFDAYVDSGKCSTDGVYAVFTSGDPVECWEFCETSSPLAVDYDVITGDCRCHTTCACRDDVDDGETICRAVSSQNELCYTMFTSSSEAETSPGACYDALQDQGCGNSYISFVSTDMYGSTYCGCCDYSYMEGMSTDMDTYSPMGSEVAYTYSCYTESPSSSHSNSNYYYSSMYMYGSMNSPWSMNMNSSTYLLMATGASLPSVCPDEFAAYYLDSGGACDSDSPYSMGSTSTRSECYEACASQFGQSLVAAQWNEMSGGECTCYSSCDCLAEGNDGKAGRRMVVD